MNNHTPSLADLEARLAKLERQNRRWKWLGFLLLLIAGSGFLLAQVLRKPLSAAPGPATRAASYDTLVVHRLELRDKAGKLRGVWAAEDKECLLELYDPAGKPRAALREGNLLLVGQNDKVTAVLNAAGAGPYLSLEDAQQFRAVVGVTETEVIATGESRTTSAVAVTLFGKDGKVIWHAP